MIRDPTAKSCSASTWLKYFRYLKSLTDDIVEEIMLQMISISQIEVDVDMNLIVVLLVKIIRICNTFLCTKSFFFEDSLEPRSHVSEPRRVP